MEKPMKKRNRLLVGLTALLLVVGLAAHQGDVSAASLTAQVKVEITSTLTNTLDLSVASAPLNTAPIQNFANGVGASQANVIWGDERTLTTASTEDIDFAGGGLTDAFGVAVAPVKIRALLIISASANTTNLTLFGDANSIPFLNTAATTVTLQPGGMYLYTAPATAGVTVTAGTGDIVQVANAAGASATYRIIAIGTAS